MYHQSISHIVIVYPVPKSIRQSCTDAFTIHEPPQIGKLHNASKTIYILNIKYIHVYIYACFELYIDIHLNKNIYIYT